MLNRAISMEVRFNTFPLSWWWDHFPFQYLIIFKRIFLVARYRALSPVSTLRDHIEPEHALIDKGKMELKLSMIYQLNRIWRVPAQGGSWQPTVLQNPVRTQTVLFLQHALCSEVPSIGGIFNCMVAPQTFYTYTTWPCQFYTFQIIDWYR